LDPDSIDTVIKADQNIPKFSCLITKFATVKLVKFPHEKKPWCGSGLDQDSTKLRYGYGSRLRKCLGDDPDSANLDPRHCFYYSIFLENKNLRVSIILDVQTSIGSFRYRTVLTKRLISAFSRNPISIFTIFDCFLRKRENVQEFTKMPNSHKKLKNPENEMENISW
jgi:hypothetical protein